MFYYFNAEMKFWEKPAPPIDPVLNNNDWETIQYAAQKGIASDYWNVGDRVEVTLNGTCRARTFDNKKVYAFIIGFNHNATLEGDNTIHFQIGYDSLEGGKPIALTDTYNGAYTQGTREFSVNTTNTNVGGWENSFMRTTVIPDFIKCLPSDLQDVLKAIPKYTDNFGNKSNIEAHVTATQDKVFTLAEYEVWGGRTYGNQYEASKQMQYDYYKNNGSTIKYNDQNTGTAVIWWERSANYNNATTTCRVSNSGAVAGGNSSYSLGFAPAFVVG